MENASKLIIDYARRGVELREEFFKNNVEKIRAAAFRTAIAIASGGKLLLCGNGGSAADAQHIAGEFVNRFLIDRPALPAIALTTDTSVLTAIGNDSNFAKIFSRQIEALGQKGDALLAISTSGNSANILNALVAAKEKGIIIIGLTGRGGGAMKDQCDILIEAPCNETPLIQELHLACEHIFCSLTDYFLFENVGAIAPFLHN